MERPGRVSSASSSGRSGSRKRVRSKSPTDEFRKPKDTRVSRPTCRPTTTVKSSDKDRKDQPKITNFQCKQTHKMASSEKNNGEKKPLSEFEALVLERLEKLDTKMDEINRKLDARIEVLESRVYDIEQVQDKCAKDVEKIQRQQELGEELLINNETAAKVSLEKSMSNEQYTRNFNIRIFNLEEGEKETITECEEKVLKLFNDKLNVKVPIEAIDVLHRVGKKQHTQVAHVESSVDSKNKSATQDKATPAEKNTDKNTDGQIESASALADAGQPKQDNKKQNKINSRPVIVSFLSRRVKQQVIDNRFKLKKKTKDEIPIILVEDLTKQNHALLCKAKDTEKFSSVWSRDGNIWAKQQNGVIVPIKSHADIDAPPVKLQEPAFHAGNTLRYTPKHNTRGGQRGRGFNPRRGFGYHGYGDRGLNLQNKFDILGQDNQSVVDMNSDEERNEFD